MAVTFWRYLREWVWAKNRTLQESFSRGEGRSIKAQDKGPQSQAPAARPQSPAVRGFPRFRNRSLRCTLRGVFAVLGEREGHQAPATADFSRWTFRSQTAKPPLSTTRKSDFCTVAIFGGKRVYFAPLYSIERGFDRPKIAPLKPKENARQRKNCAAIGKDEALHLREHK